MKEKFENALSSAITDIIDGKPLTLDSECFEGLCEEHKSFIYSYLHSIGMCDFQNLVDDIDKLVPCGRDMLSGKFDEYEFLEVFAISDSDINSAVNIIEWYGNIETAVYFKKLQNKKHIYSGYLCVDSVISYRPSFGCNNKGWVYLSNRSVAWIDEIEGEWFFINENLFQDYNDIVSIDEVQEMLKIGRNSAYSLLKDGVIKSIRVGKKYIVPKQAVVDFVNSGIA